MGQYSAFTTMSNGIANRLINEAQVINNIEHLVADTKAAQWDTGATNTCVSKNIVNLLKLKPVGVMKIQTPSGSTEVNQYLVDIKLRNDVLVKDVMVVDSEIGNQGIDVLIGMDIIGTGDFAVSNFEGKTYFSFRYPSVAHTDYVQYLKNISPVHKDKTYPNDPCPCGSGKKYKKCCGRK